MEDVSTEDLGFGVYSLKVGAGEMAAIFCWSHRRLAQHSLGRRSEWAKSARLRATYLPMYLGENK